MVRVFLLVFIIIALGSCSSSSVLSVDKTNICAVFAEKSSWKKWSKRASKKYGTPVPIIMAFMYQESRFQANAKPPKKRWFGIFPYSASSAYGYAQAKKQTWQWYRQQTGKKRASRSSFKDSAYFIAWYNRYSNTNNKIKLTDTKNLYLAYHEGHSGFKNRSYKSKKWLVKVASKVEKMAKNYKKQLRNC